MRWALGIALALWATLGAVLAQEELTPVVRAEMGQEVVSVGQPVILRVTVLVPTWMTSPPVFPSFETPNVILRLPHRATSPVSERINGETWSGVSRAYRLYPMVPGQLAFADKSMQVTYADPADNSPVTEDVSIPATRVTATVPEGAEGLDPLIVAEKVTLEQRISGPESTLAEGDAVTREIVATITGSSPMFLPPLLEETASEAVQAYVSEPVLKESENRGVLSGERTDSVTYVALFKGQLDLPEISLTWFNVRSGAVETATLPGQVFEIDAPEKPREPILTRRQMVVLGLLCVFLAGGIWIAGRWVWPAVMQWRDDRRQAYQLSEAFAAHGLRAAIRQKDLSAVHAARRLWDQRLAPTAPNREAAFEAAIVAIGASQFGNGAAADWPSVERCFDKLREARLDAQKCNAKAQALPPLNPF